MAGFEAIYERMSAVGIDGEIWVDGSFLTKKNEPDDIDFVLMVSARFYDDGTPEQKQLIDWLIDNEDDPKKSFLCHTDAGLVYDELSPLRYLTVDTYRHWEQDVYGFSVATHEPKGIVVVAISQASIEPIESESEQAEGIVK